jgi:hypothetical protein
MTKNFEKPVTLSDLTFEVVELRKNFPDLKILVNIEGSGESEVRRITIRDDCIVLEEI